MTKKKVYVETTHYDEGLEEIWRIKREIASEYATLDDYFKGMLDYQEERRKSGVKFVRLPPKRLSEQEGLTSLSVAEAPAEYDAGRPDSARNPVASPSETG